MLRRSVAFALWTYFAWYLGAFIASAAGLPFIIGPLSGALMAAYVLSQWRRPHRRHQPVPAKGFELSR